MMFVVSLCTVLSATVLHAVSFRDWNGIPMRDTTASVDVDSLTLSVLESHNVLLDPHSYFYPFAFRPSDSLAVQLRKMLPSTVSQQCNDESVFFPALTAWVHAQWRHDPYNSVAAHANSVEILQRAARGERFTCVEFARVLTDMLISHGYAARMTGLSRRNISNPKMGARHVVTEVWSCHHHKWMMLDAQFGSLAERNGVPLHVAELQEAVRTKDSSLVLKVWTGQTFVNRQAFDSSAYAQLLRNLDSFVDIPYIVNDQAGVLMLVPKDRNEPLLFQGQAISNTQYTKNLQDLYASLGDVHMDLKFVARDKPGSPALLHPVYEVTTTTSYPFTRYLEVSIDGAAWKRVNEPTTLWTLHNGENSFAVRTVCYSGCTTTPASLVVYHGLRKDAREARRRRSEPQPVPESSK